MTGREDSEASDLLLESLREARRQVLEAEREIRLLLAYGREFARPRPYRLADLAEACGMSISGVRTAYTQDDIDTVADQLARPVSGSASSWLNGRRVLARAGVVPAVVLAAGLLVAPQAHADVPVGSSPWTVTDLSGPPAPASTTPAAAAPASAGRASARVERGGSWVSRFGVRHRIRHGCGVVAVTGSGRVWPVRPGDTLSLISACTRVPVTVLAGANGLADPDRIMAGARLVIPG